MGRPRMRTGMAVAGGMLLAGVMSTPAHAVTPVSCSTAALITAITNANAGTGDTLSLTSHCVYTLTDADGSLPTITKPLVIQGHHATIRRDPAATTDFRIFRVGATSLTMDTLSVKNGNAGAGPGGGVLLNTTGASLTATGVIFQGNTASSGGGITAGPHTTLSLTGSTIEDNQAPNGGGGILAFGAAAVTLNSVTVSGNQTNGVGGGLEFSSVSSPASITHSVISHNTAQLEAGGIYYNGSSSLSATGTVIAGNRVTNSTLGGGGILFNPLAGGSVTIADSTISHNTVTGWTTPDGLSNRGGGIFSLGSSLTLNNTRVTGNRLIGTSGQGAGIAAEGLLSAATLTLGNGTLVVGNIAYGQNAQGGGLYTDSNADGVTVSVNGSHIDANKVRGTGSAAAGIFNLDGTFSFATSSVNNNSAPNAPGGVSTTVPITTVDGATTFTGNTPTNCSLSPAPVTNCTG
ncbi:right-handed parallel beta-helix repeat-containing protein [Streptomyces sp. NPDC047022]|uniref:right-handed parallel beta-helix repeat-containing protein n=1 Tax=Streptomyces sp. NPDC047022 TaxID=3155737 RepID=UPI0033FC2A81